MKTAVITVLVFEEVDALDVNEIIYGNENDIHSLYGLLRKPIGRRVAQAILEKWLVPKDELDMLESK